VEDFAREWDVSENRSLSEGRETRKYSLWNVNAATRWLNLKRKHGIPNSETHGRGHPKVRKLKRGGIRLSYRGGVVRYPQTGRRRWAEGSFLEGE